MTPRAELHHSIPGRTRLRLPARRGDVGYFTRLRAALEAIPGISEVRVNARIGGVTLLHPGLSSEPIYVWAAENGWFQIDDARLHPDYFLQGVTRDISAASRRLASARQAAASGVRMRNALFVALVIMGISQTVRGQITAPAVTLFWYALNCDLPAVPAEV
ncbi:MAG: hypothetical protein L0H73_02735 [Nitrococcus sp.]|nr:hypothetical protein [Nitrococcus sp.]